MEFSRQEYWSGLPFPSPRDEKTEAQITKLAKPGPELDSNPKLQTVMMAGVYNLRVKEVRVKTPGPREIEG